MKRQRSWQNSLLERDDSLKAAPEEHVRQEEMKKKITFSALCIVGLGLALVFLLPPPIEGYYRSDAATILDGESTGYLLLRGGKAEIVNFRHGRREVQAVGSYSTDGRRLTLSIPVNSEEFTGRVFLWGIHWSGHDAPECFMRRAFPE